MNSSLLTSWAFVLALATVITEAKAQEGKGHRARPPAELAKIDRRILREPAYTAAEQLYCLLVFGPQAKLRLWLVMDGNILYVDRNGNGDLTEPGERLKRLGGAGSAFEVVLPERLRKTKDDYLKVLSGQIISYRGSKLWQNSYPVWSKKPSKAPILHFNGPVTLRLDTPAEPRFGATIGLLGILPRGGRAYFSGYLGTPGLSASNSFTTSDPNQDDSYVDYNAGRVVPANGYRSVEFEFPCRDKKLISVRAKGSIEVDEGDPLMLAAFCVVPETAKLGKVNIKVYLPGRNDIHGTPVTVPDVTIWGPAKTAEERLSVNEFEQLWRELGKPRAEWAAYQLASYPKQSIPLLSKKLERRTLNRLLTLAHIDTP